MLSATLFAKGLVIGFSIAAPVGPIGVLCIRRTLAEGRASGLLTGLGAATADALYGAIAGFGLSIATQFLIGQQAWIRWIGGLFLIYLGVKTFLARAAETPAVVRGGGLLASYFSTFFLTLTNPMTILSFVAVFAGLGLGAQTQGVASASVLVAGVFVGSAAWWLVLSGLVSLMRDRVSSRALRWVNRISGAIITVFGLIAIASMASC